VVVASVAAEARPVMAIRAPQPAAAVAAAANPSPAVLAGPPTSRLHRVLALQGAPVPAAPARIVALIDRTPQPIATAQQDAAIALRAVPVTSNPRRGTVTALIARTPPPLTAPVRYARVEVLNGAGRQGLAARYGSYLKSSGWSAPRIADALHRHEQSLILYTPEGKDRAMRLARRLPFTPRLVEKPAGSHVVLVLGADSLAFDGRLRKTSKPS